jgi:rhodanese-related sulfurtransferase
MKTISLLVVCALLFGGFAVAGEIDGTLIRFAETALLVETSDGLEIVMLDRGASLVGIQNRTDLETGLSLEISWSREVNGVKMAEVLRVAPEAVTDPLYWIDIREFRQLHGKAEIVVVDARTKEDFEAGHIPGAISVPMDRIDEWLSLAQPDPDTHFVFYSDGPRCPLAQQAVRSAVAAGFDDSRSLRGGWPSWVRSRGYLEVEPALLQRSQDRTFMVIDVQDFPSDETLPGAFSVPSNQALLERELFLGQPWMPPFLFVGRDGSDMSVVEVVDKVMAWRSTDQERATTPVFVLAGGVAAWSAAGYGTVALSEAPTEVVFNADPSSGQISPAEFKKLWNETSGNTVLLDVREPRTRTDERSTHLPLEQLARRVNELDTEQPVVVFCDFGNRSAIAYLLLSRLGYEVRYLPFGFGAIN